MIQRPLYLNELIRARKNGFPKVVIGVRRYAFRSWIISMPNQLGKESLSPFISQAIPTVNGS